MFEDMLGALHITSLKRLIDLHEIHSVDRRSRTSMESALLEVYNGNSEIFNELDDDELLGVSEYLDLTLKTEDRLGAIVAICKNYGVEVQLNDEPQTESIEPASNRTLTESKISTEGLEVPASTMNNDKHLQRKASVSEVSTVSGSGLFLGLMILIFIVPGKTLAWIWYLFPSKGNVLASGRRRDNSFVHVLYSIGFWVFVLYVIIGSNQHK